MLETTASQLRKNLRREIQRCTESHEVLRVKQQDGEDLDW
jgi:hypothetical protein